MRIIAGKYRGTALASVGKGDVTAHLRPTTDRVRENIFNLLQGGRYDDPLSGARVLDLFAGTGALGLEALSRGAAMVHFIDDGSAASRLIRANIAALGAQADATFSRQNAARLGPCPTQPFDLVFLDPPYGKGLGEAAINSAFKGGWLSPTSLIVFEEGAARTAPPGTQLLDSRRYGNTHIHILAPEPD